MSLSVALIDDIPAIKPTDRAMISIIIPTYNRAAYLKEAIQSVLDQDYFDGREAAKAYELIIVDDGSTDETEGVAKEFENRLRYVRQPQCGVSAARNTGLALAKGDIIAFLDSDDLWKPQKLSVQMSLMSVRPRTKLCYADEIWVRNGVAVNPKMRHRKYSGWIFDKVLPLCLLSLSSALFRREVFEEVGRFDESLPVCEDYDLGIRLAHRYPIHFIESFLIIKRGGHADQLSKKYWGMDRFRVKALEKALRLDLTSRQQELVKREIVTKSRVLVTGFEKRGKREEADVYRRKMMAYSQPS
jgi:glycosyltransferase involved in cell wall biosynthesis